MNAGNVRKDLRCCKKSGKGTKESVAQNAILINLKRCFQRSVLEHQRARRPSVRLILHRDIAEVIAKGSGTPSP